MGRKWIIEGYDGNALMFRHELTGRLSSSRIHRLLAQLAARDLSVEEVVNASRYPRDQLYVPLLERIGSRPVSYGRSGKSYTARFEEASKK